MLIHEHENKEGLDAQLCHFADAAQETDFSGVGRWVSRGLRLGASSDEVKRWVKPYVRHVQTLDAPRSSGFGS